MKTISQNQLAEMLKNVKGTTMASILYFVDESGARTINKEKCIKKLTFTPVTLGSEYSRKIERILKTKQGADESYEFEAKKMSGRTLLASTLVQTDRTGVLGIYGIVENHNRKAVRSKLFYDGKMYDKKELENLHLSGAVNCFMPSHFTKDSTKGRGAVDAANDFGIVTTHLKNIRKIKMYGQVYRVRD